MAIMVPVSWGELLDKITILEIKSERLADAAKLVNVRAELEALRNMRDGAATLPEAAQPLVAELHAVNAQLWDIEDAIRVCEADGDFGDRFVALARSVYFTNDRRAALKRALNMLLDSALMEEKSYEDYSGGRTPAP